MQIRLPLLRGSIACFNVARSLNKWEQLCTNHKWPCSFTLMNFLHENELFQRGWGGLCHTCGNSGGVGGGGRGRSSVPYKNGKSTVVLSEIPSVVGVWIFLEPQYQEQWYNWFKREDFLDTDLRYVNMCLTL